MVSLQSISLNSTDKIATVSLFADSKSEVTSGMTVNGLPADYTIGQGSTVMTASGEIAFMKSDGTWSWV